MIEIPSYQNPTPTVESRTSLSEVVDSLEEKCGKCKPLTPLTCVVECKTWKLKNQLRKMHEKVCKPDFAVILLNTLKNERRLKIIEIMSEHSYSISKIQDKMKSLGYKHSQQTIFEEYVNPLIEVGLVQEGQNPYDLTLFGSRVNGLMKDFLDLEQILPPHSECYEEKVLDSLLDKPKTYEEMRKTVPAKSIGRVMSRLQRSALVQTSKEKNYIFFFRTKRNISLEKLSPTEEKVYQDIPDEGISAGKLSNKSGISLRRTYKYIRKLKGKKLVFERRRPLTYSLTAQGLRVASMLENIGNLVAETQDATKRLLEDEGTSDPSKLATKVNVDKKKAVRFQ
jgi:predicted transcriptional regulator